MRRYLTLLAALALAAPSFTGCSMDIFRKAKPPKVTGEPETLTYAKELRVDLPRMTKTASGLYYLDHQIGAGEVAERNDTVCVGYVGSLADGSVFDRSGMGQPYTFVLGAGEVITGWDEGIQGMRVGGSRLLVVPPGLAYGNLSPGAGIPPNATLVFEVTLDAVH